VIGGLKKDRQTSVRLMPQLLISMVSINISDNVFPLKSNDVNINIALYYTDLHAHEPVN